MAFRFEQLEVWVEANVLATKIYTVTKRFPKEELFALTSQIRRSAGSIAANIAEGSGGNSKKDFCHYLDIAIKSLYETVSHLYLSEQQGYISKGEREILYNEAEVLVKKICALRKSLQ